MIGRNKMENDYEKRIGNLERDNRELINDKIMYLGILLTIVIANVL